MFTLTTFITHKDCTVCFSLDSICKTHLDCALDITRKTMIAHLEAAVSLMSPVKKDLLCFLYCSAPPSNIYDHDHKQLILTILTPVKTHIKHLLITNEQLTQTLVFIIFWKKIIETREGRNHLKVLTHLNLFFYHTSVFWHVSLYIFST